MQDRGQNVQDVAGLENEEKKLAVVLAKLPKEYEEFLVELDLALRVRQVGVFQRIHQQSRHPLQDEVEVFFAVNPRQVV